MNAPSSRLNDTTRLAECMTSEISERWPKPKMCLNSRAQTGRKHQQQHVQQMERQPTSQPIILTCLCMTLAFGYDANVFAGFASRLILSTRIDLRDSLLDPQLLCIEMLDASWSTTKKNGLASGCINRVLHRITPALASHFLENGQNADEPGQTVQATIDPCFAGATGGRRHRC